MVASLQSVSRLRDFGTSRWWPWTIFNRIRRASLFQSLADIERQDPLDALPSLHGPSSIARKTGEASFKCFEETWNRTSECCWFGAMLEADPSSRVVPFDTPFAFRVVDRGWNKFGAGAGAGAVVFEMGRDPCESFIASCLNAWLVAAVVNLMEAKRGRRTWALGLWRTNSRSACGSNVYDKSDMIDVNRSPTTGHQYVQSLDVVWLGMKWERSAWRLHRPSPHPLPTRVKGGPGQCDTCLASHCRVYIMASR